MLLLAPRAAASWVAPAVLAPTYFD